MQADIFDVKIEKEANEQGPGMGAAMLAAYGCGWFSYFVYTIKTVFEGMGINRILQKQRPIAKMASVN